MSTAAARIGRTWSGLFSLFPVLGSELAVFSHRHHGAGFASKLARGLWSLGPSAWP